MSYKQDVRSMLRVVMGTGITCDHKKGDIATVTCSQCNASWCCTECAIECDAVDIEHFDWMYNEHGPYSIICCQCSGSEPCWKASH